NLRRETTGEVRSWNVATGQETALLPRGPFGMVWDAQFSHDGRFAWILHRRDKADKPGQVVLQVWDTAAQKAVLWLNSASLAAFSSDGARLSALTDKSDEAVWSIPDGKQLAALPLVKGYVVGRVWSPDGKYLFLGTMRGYLWRWEPGSGAPPVEVES